MAQLSHPADSSRDDRIGRPEGDSPESHDVVILGIMFCSSYIARGKDWQVWVIYFPVPEPHIDEQKQHTHFTNSGSEMPR